MEEHRTARTLHSKWHWLSFCNPDLPEGERFLGVAIVKSFSFGTAVMDAHMLGINPGGECAGMEIPDEDLPDAQWRNRLLTRAELEAFEENENG